MTHLRLASSERGLLAKMMNAKSGMRGTELLRCRRAAPPTCLPAQQNERVRSKGENSTPRRRIGTGFGPASRRSRDARGRRTKPHLQTPTKCRERAVGALPLRRASLRSRTRASDRKVRTRRHDVGSGPGLKWHRVGRAQEARNALRLTSKLPVAAENELPTYPLSCVLLYASYPCPAGARVRCSLCRLCVCMCVYDTYAEDIPEARTRTSKPQNHDSGSLSVWST